jgi:hypothetical protein
MNILIAILIVGGIITVARKPFRTSTLAGDITVFLTWPFVVVQEAYHVNLGRDKKLISRLRTRLIAEEDMRSDLINGLKRLDRVEFEDKHYISAQSVIQLAVRNPPSV